MRIIDIWIRKNGERWEDGTPYITDECANVYMLLPVSKDYFAGEPNSVERLIRIMPAAIQAEREIKQGGSQ
jgi:hypothetical protein